MNKFTRKINNSCARFSFWDALTRHFAEFENLIHPQDVLTHEDKIALKEIHKLLYRGYKASKERRKIHLEKIYKLSEEKKL